MELNEGKGFVYTLEAVIAAIMFLTVIFVAIPGLQADGVSDKNVQNQVFAALEALESAGELENASNEDLSEELESFVPSGFEYSVRFDTRHSNISYFKSGEDYSVGKEGDSPELQIWVEEASDLDAKFNGETIFEEVDGSESFYTSVSEASGELSFEGEGSGWFEFGVYDSEGEIPDESDVLVVNYVLNQEKLSMVQVFLWRE